ncbi:hypothetical protein GCM10007890_19380 [Methylobacterium tardum]|uniref:Uncharacterized protein n=1 Tax=Methylobacterium tardum TaxID=374432 RepID=A0AA37WQ93_9HYPH|nr:hypothetical protein GCM10007890_19380 [Methylobacterium tardum]
MRAKPATTGTRVACVSHIRRSAVAEHAVTDLSLRLNRLSLGLILGPVAAEATVLLGIFWL